MKQITCKSGTKGWQGKLQRQYANFEEFEGYDSNFNLANRLGFKTAREAWEANPLIQGSVNPSDYSLAYTKPTSKRIS